MIPEDIRGQLRTQPFHPIRVFLSDGCTYDVRHPEMMMVGRTQVVIGITRPGRLVFDRFAYCDPVHIVRIEPINGTPKNGRRSRRK